MSENGKKRGLLHSAALQFLAGAGSGFITKTAVAPLERIKILLQLQGMDGLVPPGKYTGILQTGRVIVQEEGVLALYKGNGANVARIVPVYAIKFALNDTFKDILRRPGEKLHELSSERVLAAGMMSGLVQNTLTCPLEVIRTRLSMGKEIGKAEYKGIIDCGRRMVVEEGVGSLFKGMSPILITAAPYVGFQMAFYEYFRRVFPIDEHGKSALSSTLVAGAFAGLFAQSITYPGDTLKRRMQANGVGGKPRIYTSTWDCVKKVTQKEGWRAFYKGLQANIVKCFPEAAIQFAAYEYLKNALYASAL